MTDEARWEKLDLTSYAFQKSAAQLTEALKHRIDLLEDTDDALHTPLICARAWR
jgi:hypothetical protein